MVFLVDNHESFKITACFTQKKKFSIHTLIVMKYVFLFFRMKDLLSEMRLMIILLKKLIKKSNPI